MSYLKLAMTALSGAGLITKLIIALGLAASLLAAYGVWHHRVYRSGFDAAIARIAAADERLVQRALKQRGELKLCQASGRSWDQSTGRCQ